MHSTVFDIAKVLYIAFHLILENETVSFNGVKPILHGVIELGTSELWNPLARGGSSQRFV